MKRALSIKDIRAYKPTVMEFDGRWLDSIGKPELTGSWIIWGGSANGKTRFALQLAKYLGRFGKVAYDSLEEGLSLSMQKAIGDVGMADNKRSFVLLDKESVAEGKRVDVDGRSAHIIIIDSLQYTGLTYADYKRLRDRFRHKLFIFVSHASGREPKGEVGKSVKYDAFVKIYVEGYVAYPQSRYGGGDPFVIWEDGARKYGNL